MINKIYINSSANNIIKNANRAINKIIWKVKLTQIAKKKLVKT